MLWGVYMSGVVVVEGDDINRLVRSVGGGGGGSVGGGGEPRGAADPMGTNTSVVAWLFCRS